jgi:cytochrome c-type biogenesis protein CcmH
MRAVDVRALRYRQRAMQAGQIPTVSRLALALALACALLGACDRQTERFDPNERPRAPDLSKIFPAGADRSAAADAERRAPGLPDPPPAATRGAPPPVASGAPVRGSVALAPGLAAPVPAGAVLFVIARQGGSGPPVAVKRIAEPRFPVAFEIGPNDRMIEAIPFQGPFTLTARVDVDGNATTRSPGDLQGAADAPVEAGAHDVSILIDEVL